MEEEGEAKYNNSGHGEEMEVDSPGSLSRAGQSAWKISSPVES